MTEQEIRQIAERCADGMAEKAGVFVEDDRIDGLAATLAAYLLAAGLPGAGPGQSIVTG